MYSHWLNTNYFKTWENNKKPQDYPGMFLFSLFKYHESKIPLLFWMVINILFISIYFPINYASKMFGRGMFDIKGKRLSKQTEQSNKIVISYNFFPIQGLNYSNKK